MAKKRRKNAARKTAKKHPILFAILLLLITTLVGCWVLHTRGIVRIPFLDGLTSQEEESAEKEPVNATGGAFTEADITTISESELSIHFLELGNKYTGDSTLIKVGNTEVLIDAGSRMNSASTIISYVDRFCTDGVLEYVIATHAHQDHIAGFVGNKSGDTRTGIFYEYEIQTLIQFPLTGMSLETESGNPTLYANYLAAVEHLQEQGTTVYTALECWYNQNGAQRSYTLGEGISMNILYQKFYEEETSDENDYSVCMLLTQGENHYLFTGDLESEGERSLLERNDLPKCALFKGGHHGSPTSSTAELLAEIDPDIVCVCCCCGSDEYTKNVANMFPSQAFVNRIAPYTKEVYVTTIVSENEDGFESMNGNIVVMSNDGEVTVRCSNNATLFKDTEWFQANRAMPDAWK